MIFFGIKYDTLPKTKNLEFRWTNYGSNMYTVHLYRNLLKSDLLRESKEKFGTLRWIYGYENVDKCCTMALTKNMEV